MAIALVDSDAVGIGVTGAGVVYNFPTGAPGTTDLDVLCVNSDALIDTPVGGWVLRQSQVGGQGAYIFSRLGGSGSSVTISSPSGAGPFNAVVFWSRWTGTNAFDVTTGAQINGVNGNTTPAVNTGVLSEANELVVAFGALHGIGVANQNTPVWSSGYSPLEFTMQGTGGSGCIAAGGYKLGAGTAAETPNVSWSGVGADERYMLVATFTEAAVDMQVSPDSLPLALSFGEPTVVDESMTIEPASLGDTIVFGNPTLVGPTSNDPVLGMFEAALNCLRAAVNARPGAPANICARIGSEIAHDVDMTTDLCCEGLGYVSLGETYPSSDSFPEQDIVRQANARCMPPSWAQEFRIGIIRCVPSVMNDLGGMPSCDDWTAASFQNILDAASLRQMACCFRAWVLDQPFLDGMSVVIQRQTQGNPLGGCVERYLTIMVQFPNCDCI